MINMKYYLVFSIIIILFLSCSSNREPLPEEFFGMKLQRKLTGNEAKDFVDRLHFQNVATEKNEIGFYTAPIGNAIIYLTYYANDKIAEEDFQKMTQKISPENSVFVQGKFENINNKQVYSCLGLGQVHYVFAHKNVLFWISANPNFSRNFCVEYLNFVTR